MFRRHSGQFSIAAVRALWLGCLRQGNVDVDRLFGRKTLGRTHREAKSPGHIRFAYCSGDARWSIEFVIDGRQRPLSQAVVRQ